MILIVGAGAVGTVLASYLSAAGREPLRLYVRDKDRLDFAAAPRLQLDGVAGDSLLDASRPELVDTLDLRGVDYLFVCVKFAGLEKLLDELPSNSSFPAACTVVSTLNGIEPLRVLRRRLPDACVVPMTVMFNAQLLAPLHGRITTRPVVIVGSADERLLGCFAGSGMKVLRANGEAEVWGKLLLNLANAVCAITHATVKDLLSNPDLRHVYVAVLDEAVALLQQAGIAYRLPLPIPYRAYRWMLLHAGPLSWWIAQIKNGVREGSYPSMVGDVEKGRTTEVTQLNGEVLRLGAEYKVATPIAYKIVQLTESLAGTVPPDYLSPAELRRGLGL